VILFRVLFFAGVYLGVFVPPGFLPVVFLFWRKNGCFGAGTLVGALLAFVAVVLAVALAVTIARVVRLGISVLFGSAFRCYSARHFGVSCSCSAQLRCSGKRIGALELGFPLSSSGAAVEVAFPHLKFNLQLQLQLKCGFCCSGERMGALELEST
jgi:hypothetical protein